MARAACSEIHTAWIMNWYVKAPYAIRRAFQSKQLKRFDVSNFAATSAMNRRLPWCSFIPVRGNIGTDMLKLNPTDLQVVKDPFSKEEITVVRAWRADVAVLSCTGCRQARKRHEAWAPEA